MNRRILILVLGAAILLPLVAIMGMLLSPTRSLGGELLPTPTSVYYEPMQQAKQDLVVYFEQACTPTEGIYYKRISDDSDAVLGFIMTAQQFKENCP